MALSVRPLGWPVAGACACRRRFLGAREEGVTDERAPGAGHIRVEILSRGRVVISVRDVRAVVVPLVGAEARAARLHKFKEDAVLELLKAAAKEEGAASLRHRPR